MQGASTASAYVLPSFLSRARSEDAVAPESSSELEGTKTATAEKFWHEAAPSKHNLALDKRKRRANKKGGGPGLATTVSRSPHSPLPLCFCLLVASSKECGASYYLERSLGRSAFLSVCGPTKPSPSMARLAMARDCRMPHSLSFTCARRPRTPSLRTRRRLGPIRDWFRLMFSTSRITFARPAAACAVPMFGFGILTLRSGRPLGQKWGQFTLFHKFSGDAAEATARSTPLHSRPPSASGARSPRARKWDGPHADALVLHGWHLRGHVGSGPSSGVERKCGY